MLRSLAYPIACALTGAASGLLVAQLATPPAPTCPQVPVLELRQVAAALSHVQVVPPAPPAPPVVAAPEPDVAALVIPDAAVRCASEGRCTIRRDFLDALFQNPARLSQQARVMPSILDGDPRGFKFYGLRPGGLPKLIGMKNGDLLVAIGGVQVRTLEQVMQQILRLRTANALDLDIERKGEPVRLHIDIE